MRRILRVAKAALVLSIVFMMTVDTANACRLFRWLFAHRAACCVSDAHTHGVALASAPIAPNAITSSPIVESAPYIESSPVFSSAPIVEYPTAGDVVVSGGGCCCGGAPVEGSVVDGGYVDGGFVEGYSDGGIISDGMPIESEIYSSGEVISDGMIMDASPVDVAPMDSVIAPAADPAFENVEDPPVANPLEEPTEAPADTQPTDDGLFDNTPADSEPADEPPADEPPADEPPADDGLFGGVDAPADNPPADDAPADDAPADDGGLFDNAAPVGDEPAGDGGLFENTVPADDAPADDGGLFDNAAPAGDKPADDGGLFDNAPADGGDEGGLFDAPADGGDEGGLFDAPADDAAGDDDGLFGNASSNDKTLVTSSEVAGEASTETILEPAPDVDATTPVDEVIEENPLSDSALEDLFSQNKPNGMRVWSDNTGTYKTVGRLVVIAKTHIRLLKENGRYSTVPLERLSNPDLDYVMAVAKKLTGTQRIASR